MAHDNWINGWPFDLKKPQTQHRLTDAELEAIHTIDPDYNPGVLQLNAEHLAMMEANHPGYKPENDYRRYVMPDTTRARLRAFLTVKCGVPPSECTTLSIEEIVAFIEVAHNEVDAPLPPTEEGVWPAQTPASRRSVAMPLSQYGDALVMDPRTFKKQALAEWGLQPAGHQRWTVQLDAMPHDIAEKIERHATQLVTDRRASRKLRAAK